MAMWPNYDFSRSLLRSFDQKQWGHLVVVIKTVVKGNRINCVKKRVLKDQQNVLTYGWKEPFSNCCTCAM